MYYLLNIFTTWIKVLATELRCLVYNLPIDLVKKKHYHRRIENQHSFTIFLYPKLSSGSGFSFFGFPHTKWSLQTLQDFFGIHILLFGFCLLIALAHRVRASLFLRSVGKANSWNGGSQSHPSFSRIHLCTLHIEDD